MRMLTPLFAAAWLTGCGGETDDDNCWYCTDSGMTATATGTADTKTDTKTETGTKTGTPTTGYLLSGQIDLATETGAFELEAGDGSCLSTIDVAGVSERTDCSSCDAAWTVSFGGVQADAKPCSSVEDLFTNFDWGLGHGDPTTLLQDKGGGWDVWPGGVSQLSGDTWTLEFGQVF